MEIMLTVEALFKALVLGEVLELVHVHVDVMKLRMAWHTVEKKGEKSQKIFAEAYDDVDPCDCMHTYTKERTCVVTNAGFSGPGSPSCLAEGRCRSCTCMPQHICTCI
jgi:hypothetical protein